MAWLVVQSLAHDLVLGHASPGWRVRAQDRAPRTGRPARPCGATSKRGNSLWTTRQRSWGC